MLLVTDCIGYMILSLTDGFLVWRCYLVHQTLSRTRSKLEAVFWIFPLILWLATTVIGAVAKGIWDSQHLSKADYILQLTAFSTNILLNLVAPAYLIVRLLLHRRVVISKWGSGAPVAQHLRTVCILLESAALNLPVAIVGIVGIGYDKYFGWVVQAVCVVTQSFASVLILHQVALGKATSQHQGNIAALQTPTTSCSSRDDESLDADIHIITKPEP